MKLLLVVFLCVSAFAGKPPPSNRGSHPYEFVRNGNPKLNDLNVKAQDQNQPGRLKSNAGDKKSNGVPPYAVLMEPVVKYSQLDPLYNQNKKKVGDLKVEGSKNTDLVRVKKDERGGENDIESQHISSKTGYALPFVDSGFGTFHQQPLSFESDDSYYEAPYSHDPEPIIEIIIKESNQSLPAPPPPPPPKKKKKEPVQVFYVKYKKEPSSHYGEGKVIYDPPIPAITPPTNNDNSYQREDEEEHHSHHYEDVTLPPKPSTTLKAIIRPDSETYHGSGIHITFGKPKSEESDIHSSHNHHGYQGDHEEQSAPQPSVLLPPKPKINPAFRSNEAQIKKRHPLPFQSPTPPPQQVFNNRPQFSTPNNYYKPTAFPSLLQNQHFAPQPFKPPVPKFQSNNLPPPQPSPASPQAPFRYTTLPNFQSFSKPQPSFSFPPSPIQPSQQPISQPLQLYSINQPNFKSSFQINSRSTPPQAYHTISNRVTQQPPNFPKNQIVSSSSPVPPFQENSKFFPQPTPSFPQSTQSFPPPPPNSFSQRPTSFPPQGNSFSHSKFPQPFFNSNQRNPIPPTLQPSNTFDVRPSPVLPTQVHPQPHHQQQLQFQQQYQQQQQQRQQQQQQQQQQQHHLQQLQQQRQEHLEHLNRLQHQQRLQSQTLQSLQQHHQTQIQQSIPFQPQLQNQQQQSQNLLSQQQHHQNLINQQQHHQNLINQQQHHQNFINQQHQQQQLNQQKPTYETEIVKSISPDLPFVNHRFESKPQAQTTFRPPFSSTIKQNVQYNVPNNVVTTTESYSRFTTTKQSTTPTPPQIEYITEDPKKKEERKKQNVAALPKEVPDDLREQLLSSGILGNADIQILDYDKIGDIPIDKLPPEALANFQAVAGSQPVPAVAKPDSEEIEPVAEGSEQLNVAVRPPSDVMEMKVIRYNPESKQGSQVPQQYVKDDATQLEPVVLNDSKYNRYLPLKVSGVQFPVPDVPELKGKNVTSVVILAPVDYEFLQKHEEVVDESRSGRRSSHPVLEVQGVHFVAGDILKTLVKRPTQENYKLWLDKENKTSVDKQSVVLLVIEPKPSEPIQEKQIFMYDIGTQKVSKLSGELSAQFVEVAESNSENDDLDEISDSAGGSFTVKNTTPAVPHVRTQRKAIAVIQKKIRNVSSR